AVSLRRDGDKVGSVAGCDVCGQRGTNLRLARVHEAAVDVNLWTRVTDRCSLVRKHRYRATGRQYVSASFPQLELGRDRGRRDVGEPARGRAAGPDEQRRRHQVTARLTEATESTARAKIERTMGNLL